MNYIKQKFIEHKYKELFQLCEDKSIPLKYFENKEFGVLYLQNRDKILSFFEQHDFLDFKSKVLDTILNSIISQHVDDTLSLFSNMNYSILSKVNGDLMKNSDFILLNREFPDLHSVDEDKIRILLEQNLVNNLLKLKEKVELNSSIISKIDTRILEPKYFDTLMNLDLSIEGKSILDILLNSDSKVKSKFFSIMDNGNLEGLKYTTQVFGENFTITKMEHSDVRQYSLDFISKVGVDTLKLGYQKDFFHENSRSFLAVDKKNFNLFQQIVQYDISTSDLKEEDFAKKYYEINGLSGINSRKMMDIFLGKNGFDIYQLNEIIVGDSYLSKKEQLKFMEDNNQSLGMIKKAYDLCRDFMANDEKLTDDMISRIRSYEKEYENLNPDEKKEFIKKNKEASECLYQAMIDYKKKEYYSYANAISSKTDFTMVPVSSKNVSSEQKEVRVKYLDGEPFQMLVHSILPTKRTNQLNGQNEIALSIIEDPRKWFDYKDQGNAKLSCSMINEEKIAAWQTEDGSDYLIFGFSENLNPDAIEGAYATDAGTSTSGNESITYDNGSLISGPQELMKETQAFSHNEIIMNRYQDGSVIKPDYLVCYSDNHFISECVLNAASTLDIPIYVINDKIYVERIVQNKQQNLGSAAEAITR